MEEASKYLEQRNYKKYLECVQQMYKQEETQENRDLCNSARKMYESHQSVVQFKEKDMGDLYCLLGVDKNATQDEIKHAYRKLVLKFHPDRSLIPESGEVLQVILNAYNTLANVDKRAGYDRDRERGAFCEAPFGNQFYDADSFTFYKQHFYSWGPEDEFDIYNFIHSMDDAFRVRSLYRRRAHRTTPDLLDAGYIKTLLAFLFLVLIISIFN